jgi:hypothetical protein
MNKLIKELELLSDSCDSHWALEINGYNKGVLDSIETVKKTITTDKQLLVNYHMFLRDNGDKHIGLSIEEFVSLYLESI